MATEHDAMHYGGMILLKNAVVVVATASVLTKSGPKRPSQATCQSILVLCSSWCADSFSMPEISKGPLWLRSTLMLMPAQ